jgi:hypothetical protein
MVTTVSIGEHDDTSAGSRDDLQAKASERRQGRARPQLPSPSGPQCGHNTSNRNNLRVPYVGRLRNLRMCGPVMVPKNSRRTSRGYRRDIGGLRGSVTKGDPTTQHGLQFGSCCSAPMRLLNTSQPKQNHVSRLVSLDRPSRQRTPIAYYSSGLGSSSAAKETLADTILQTRPATRLDP